MTKKYKPTQNNKFAVAMLTGYFDGQGYVQKHLFGYVLESLKKKIKFPPATLKT